LSSKRKRRSAPSFNAEPGADFGPALRPDKAGRLVTWGGAAMVAIESRDDPAISGRRRIVRGARRSDALAMLEARRVITKRMRDAAERFLDDCSIACGGSACDSIGMPSYSGLRSGLPERQVKAITRVNQVRLLLHSNRGAVFWLVLFENVSLRDFETARRLRHGEAAVLLRASLAALDAHYHGVPVIRLGNGFVSVPDAKHIWPSNIRA
jgi:hypothetical protein